MTIEEILALDDIEQKITLLKKGRRTEHPNRAELWADWNPSLHEIITDKEKYPDRKVLKKEEQAIYDEKTGQSRTIPAEYEMQDVNRITIPLEQDIVNIQTAFTVGTEPSLDCTPNDKDEQKLLDALKSVFRANKIKYRNKKIVRAWLSEQEVAEYWYAVEDESFWLKLWNKAKSVFGGKAKPNRKLKSVIWSPFRGDKLYPYFDDSGDMVAFSREYKKKDSDGHELVCFMTITKSMVYQWEMGGDETKENSFAHGFSKLPVLYAYRSEAYCKKIKTQRVRLEKLLSNYADCIDYHFFPILKLIGDIDGFSGKTKDRIVKLTGEGADAQYLTWEQVPTTVEFEAKTLMEMAYDMTNTPRITFEAMKGLGQASGTAFRMRFMGAHMAVENHAEDIGEFMQRRVNFVTTALGDINPSELAKASKTIDIDTELIPYLIDDLNDKVQTAVAATSGGIWSKREGIIYAGNSDRMEDELKEIKEEEAERKSADSTFTKTKEQK